MGTYIQTTPTRGRIIVADGIYSVGDKNNANIENNYVLLNFFFTHSSAGEPLRGVGLVTGGGTEHLLITAGYMFLIRVPNSRSDTLITITFNSSTPHLSSRFQELSGEWVIYILEFVVGIYHLAYEVPQSSVSLLRRKFDLHRNSK